MNLAMTMTLDGLVRALRWKAHDLAESLERGYAADSGGSATAERRQEPQERTRGADDDRRGR